MQGESTEEITGLARAMRSAGVAVHPGGKVLDIVGTGGDSIGSVNISTGACLIAAAAGARVAKHGNRSVSSKCGSADVIEVRAALLSTSSRELQQGAESAAAAGTGSCYQPGSTEC